MYDLVIIGSGPAGMTAAIYAKRAALQVLLLDKLAPGGQIINTKEIENYPGAGTIAGADLAIKMYEHCLELGVEFAFADVVAVNKNDEHFSLSTADGTSIETLSLLIATGSRPNRLHCPNEDLYAGHNLSWCAICDGAQYRDKSVIVIGGGNSAVEEACYLADIAKEVQLITMLNLTAHPVAITRLRNKKNVKIYEYYDIIAFNGKDEPFGLKARSTETGEELRLEGDGAFEYIGLAPNSESFKNLNILNEYNYITADSSMQTACPGVFAAGDVIAKNIRQVVTACSDGAVAALSAANYVRSIKK